MKLFSLSILFLVVITLNGQTLVQVDDMQIEVNEVDNSIFTADKFWRGADGAASIDLENGNILWLFSDTFIDPQGTGKRSNSKMINNSIAIQEGNSLDKGKISFYHKGKQRKPKSFFELPGKTWFWTGHGIFAKRQIRFAHVQEIVKMARVLKAYVHEAIEVEKAGLTIELKKTAEYDIPEEFQKKLNKTPALKTAFKKLTPGRQRGYLLYFSQPKQSKTREARVDRYTNQILEGKGLND